METKVRITPGNGQYDYDLPPTGRGPMGYPMESQTTDEATTLEEVINEVAGATDGNESDGYGGEATATEAVLTDGHRPISSPISRLNTTGNEGGMPDESAEADEATDTE